MLIITCGIPQSGKSTVVDKCQEFLQATLFRPGDWIPQNLAAVSQVAERDFRNSALTTAKVDILEWMEEFDPSKVVILDERNEDCNDLNDLFVKAAQHGHQVILLYVNARSTECATRSGILWDFSESASKILISIPNYKLLCDSVVVVNNNGSIDELDGKVAAIKEKLCQGM